MSNAYSLNDRFGTKPAQKQRATGVRASLADAGVFGAQIVCVAKAWLAKGFTETLPNNGDQWIKDLWNCYQNQPRTDAYCTVFAWIIAKNAATIQGCTHPFFTTTGRPDFGNTANMIKTALDNSVRVDKTPSVGAIFVRESKSGNGFNHSGIVIAVNPSSQYVLETIEGNTTSEDGTATEGIIHSFYTSARFALFEQGQMNPHPSAGYNPPASYLQGWHFIHVEDLCDATELKDGTAACFGFDITCKTKSTVIKEEKCAIDCPPGYFPRNKNNAVQTESWPFDPAGVELILKNGGRQARPDRENGQTLEQFTYARNLQQCCVPDEPPKPPGERVCDELKVNQTIERVVVPCKGGNPVVMMYPDGQIPHFKVFKDNPDFAIALLGQDETKGQNPDSIKNTPLALKMAHYAPMVTDNNGNRILLYIETQDIGSFCNQLNLAGSAEFRIKIPRTTALSEVVAWGGQGGTGNGYVERVSTLLMPRKTRGDWNNFIGKSVFDPKVDFNDVVVRETVNHQPNQPYFEGKDKDFYGQLIRLGNVWDMMEMIERSGKRNHTFTIEFSGQPITNADVWGKILDIASIAISITGTIIGVPPMITKSISRLISNITKVIVLGEPITMLLMSDCLADTVAIIAAVDQNLANEIKKYGQAALKVVAGFKQGGVQGVTAMINELGVVPGADKVIAELKNGIKTAAGTFSAAKLWVDNAWSSINTAVGGDINKIIHTGINYVQADVIGKMGAMVQNAKGDVNTAAQSIVDDILTQVNNSVPGAMTSLTSSATLRNAFTMFGSPNALLAVPGMSGVFQKAINMGELYHQDIGGDASLHAAILNLITGRPVPENALDQYTLASMMSKADNLARMGEQLILPPTLNCEISEIIRKEIEQCIPEVRCPLPYKYFNGHCVPEEFACETPPCQPTTTNEEEECPNPPCEKKTTTNIPGGCCEEKPKKLPSCIIEARNQYLYCPPVSCGIAAEESAPAAAESDECFDLTRGNSYRRGGQLYDVTVNRWTDKGGGLYKEVVSDFSAINDAILKYVSGEYLLYDVKNANEGKPMVEFTLDTDNPPAGYKMFYNFNESATVRPVMCNAAYTPATSNGAAMNDNLFGTSGGYGSTTLNPLTPVPAPVPTPTSAGNGATVMPSGNPSGSYGTATTETLPAPTAQAPAPKAGGCKYYYRAYVANPNKPNEQWYADIAGRVVPLVECCAPKTATSHTPSESLPSEITDELKRITELVCRRGAGEDCPECDLQPILDRIGNLELKISQLIITPDNSKLENLIIDLGKRVNDLTLIVGGDTTNNTNELTVDFQPLIDEITAIVTGNPQQQFDYKPYFEEIKKLIGKGDTPSLAAKLQAMVEVIANLNLDCPDPCNAPDLTPIYQQFERISREIKEKTVEVDFTPVFGRLDTIYAAIDAVARAKADVNIDWKPIFGKLDAIATAVAQCANGRCAVPDLEPYFRDLEMRLRQMPVNVTVNVPQVNVDIRPFLQGITELEARLSAQSSAQSSAQAQAIATAFAENYPKLEANLIAKIGDLIATIRVSPAAVNIDTKPFTDAVGRIETAIRNLPPPNVTVNPTPVTVNQPAPVVAVTVPPVDWSPLEPYFNDLKQLIRTLPPPNVTVNPTPVYVEGGGQITIPQPDYTPLLEKFNELKNYILTIRINPTPVTVNQPAPIVNVNMQQFQEQFQSQTQALQADLSAIASAVAELKAKPQLTVDFTPVEARLKAYIDDAMRACRSGCAVDITPVLAKSNEILTLIRTSPSPERFDYQRITQLVDGLRDWIQTVQINVPAPIVNVNMSQFQQQNQSQIQTAMAALQGDLAGRFAGLTEQLQQLIARPNTTTSAVDLTDLENRIRQMVNNAIMSVSLAPNTAAAMQDLTPITSKLSTIEGLVRNLKMACPQCELDYSRIESPFYDFKNYLQNLKVTVNQPAPIVNINVSQLQSQLQEGLRSQISQITQAIYDLPTGGGQQTQQPVTLDISEITAEIGGIITEAIGSIPRTEIPKTDLTPVLNDLRTLRAAVDANANARCDLSPLEQQITALTQYVQTMKQGMDSGFGAMTSRFNGLDTAVASLKTTLTNNFPTILGQLQTIAASTSSAATASAVASVMTKLQNELPPLLGAINTTTTATQRIEQRVNQIPTTQTTSAGVTTILPADNTTLTNAIAQLRVTVDSMNGQLGQLGQIPAMRGDVSDLQRTVYNTQDKLREFQTYLQNWSPDIPAPNVTVNPTPVNIDVAGFVQAVNSAVGNAVATLRADLQANAKAAADAKINPSDIITPVLRGMEQLIATIKFNPTITVSAPAVTVNPTPVTVNQPAPIVNVAAPIVNPTPVTVNPTPVTLNQPAPIVNLPAPQVTVNPTPVTVDLQTIQTALIELKNLVNANKTTCPQCVVDYARIEKQFADLKADLAVRLTPTPVASSDTVTADLISGIRSLVAASQNPVVASNCDLSAVNAKLTDLLLTAKALPIFDPSAQTKTVQTAIEKGLNEIRAAIMQTQPAPLPTPVLNCPTCEKCDLSGITPKLMQILDLLTRNVSEGVDLTSLVQGQQTTLTELRSFRQDYNQNRVTGSDISSITLALRDLQKETSELLQREAGRQIVSAVSTDADMLRELTERMNSMNETVTDMNRSVGAMNLIDVRRDLQSVKSEMATMRQDYAKLRDSVEAAMQFARSNNTGYDGTAIAEIKQMIYEQGQHYEQSIGQLMAELAALKHGGDYAHSPTPPVQRPQSVTPCCNERTQFEPNNCCGGVPAIVESHTRTIYEGGMNGGRGKYGQYAPMNTPQRQRQPQQRYNDFS